MPIKASDLKYELINAEETLTKADLSTEEGIKQAFFALLKVMSIHSRMGLDVRTNTTKIMKHLNIEFTTDYKENLEG